MGEGNAIWRISQTWSRSYRVGKRVKSEKKLSKGEIVTWGDVTKPEGFTNLCSYKMRQEMISKFLEK